MGNKTLKTSAVLGVKAIKFFVGPNKITISSASRQRDRKYLETTIFACKRFLKLVNLVMKGTILFACLSDHDKCLTKTRLTLVFTV